MGCGDLEGCERMFLMERTMNQSSEFKNDHDELCRACSRRELAALVGVCFLGLIALLAFVLWAVELLMCIGGMK